MKKILVLFSHPKYEKSRVNSTLIEHIKDKKNVTFHDLYEQYPDFHIDVSKEKQLLEQHDIIIWHHPFYWYSCPPLMKQWIDMVLEFNWAYGPEGKALQNKIKELEGTLGSAQDINDSYQRDISKLQQSIEELKADLARVKEDHQYDNLVHQKELADFRKGRWDPNFKPLDGSEK